MKAFRFSLERILALRERQENQARLDLAATVAEIARSEDEIRRLRGRIMQRRAWIDRRLRESAKPSFLGQAVAHVRGLELRVTAGQERLESLEEDRRKKEQAYRTARGARRTLEKLKERRRRRYLQEHSRKEARLYDAFIQYQSSATREEREPGR